MVDWVWARSDAGGDVVKNELRSLGRVAMAALGDAMTRVGNGTNLPRQDESLGGGLRAVRVTVGGDEYRMIYARSGGALVALHAFQKRQRQLRQRDLDLAKARLAMHRRQS